MASLRNEFSWSHSRAACFDACPRQYYFHYYGAWGGWERTAEARVRTLYILRQLQTRQQWMGATVHNCLRWVLTTLGRTGEAPAEELVLHQLGRRLQRDFAASGEGLYWEDPKGNAALLEHEYDDLEAPDEVWQALFARALECVSTFYQSPLLRDIARVPAARWRELEERSSFMLDELKVWVQLDFALEDNGLRIFDWKTGRANAESTRQQLALYALYARDRWQTEPQALTMVEFNLASNEVFERQPDPAELEAARERALTSAAAMKALLQEPDQNLGREDDFPLTENVKACQRCPFRRVCPKWADQL